MSISNKSLLLFTHSDPYIASLIRLCPLDKSFPYKKKVKNLHCFIVLSDLVKFALEQKNKRHQTHIDTHTCTYMHTHTYTNTHRHTHTHKMLLIQSSETQALLFNYHLIWIFSLFFSFAFQPKQKFKIKRKKRE